MSAWAVFWLASLQAVPAPGPAIAVEAIQHEDTQGHVFSGREIRLTLRVYGAQGRRLDLAVRPYQLTHALAVPLGPPIEVAAGVELGTSVWHDFPFALGCPAVEQAVSWELHYLARLGAEEAWQVAGRTRLELHPPDLLGPLRERAREEPWFVSDRPGALKAFLAREEIPFRDLDQPSGRDAWARSRGSRLQGPASGKRGGLLVCVRASDARGDAASAALEESPRALVFEAALPALALRRTPGRTRVTLDLGLIARLADDPRARIALVEAVELTQLEALADTDPSRE